MARFGWNYGLVSEPARASKEFQGARSGNHSSSNGRAGQIPQYSILFPNDWFGIRIWG